MLTFKYFVLIALFNFIFAIPFCIHNWAKATPYAIQIIFLWFFLIPLVLFSCPYDIVLYINT